MNLDNKQKKFIINHIQTYSLAELAQRLNLEESTILDYLKKRWREDKFEKYLASQKNLVDNNITNFQFQQFFAANKGYFFVLLLLVGICYVNSLGNGFVSDDIGAIRDNPNLGNFSNVTAHFIGSLQSFFYYLIFHIDGANPSYFRLVNILFHLGNTFLIFIILNILHNKKVAFIAASLFAVHPMLVEAITWISGFTYNQYTFYFLVSFLFYLLYYQKKNVRYFYASLLAFFFSVYASEKAIALPAVFVAYELAYGNLKKNWKPIAAYFLVMIPILLIFASRIDNRLASVAAESYNGSQRVGYFYQLPIAISVYLKLILWPNMLSLYQTEYTYTLLEYFGSLLVFLVYLGFLVWAFFKNKPYFFWGSLFLIALSPTLTPFGISWLVAERYAYLSTLGILVMLSLLAAQMMEKDKIKMFVIGFLSIVVVALGIRTIVRNVDWKNEDNLWFTTVKVAPSGQTIHNNLGDVYARRNEYDKAIAEFQKALEINPQYADAAHNLANVYYKVGRKEESIQTYEKSIQINPRLWQSYLNLALIYYFEKNPELMEKNLNLALENAPDKNQILPTIQYIKEHPDSSEIQK